VKDKSIAIAVVCVALASIVSAQQTPVHLEDNGAIHGSGTVNFIPRFTGPRALGVSNIFQSPGGNIGIGTTDPRFPVHVFSNRFLPPSGQDFPVALFVESSGASDLTNVIGIEGLASAGSGRNIGVDGVTYSPEGNGVLGNQPLTDVNGGGGVIGLTSATSGFSYGTRGDALGTTGTAIGVFGQSYSADGGGGFFQTVNPVGGIGVTGVSYATGGFPIGVRGLTVATSGGGAAVFGVASSANSFGGMFVNEAGGTILVGSIGPAPTATAVFKVDGTGRVYADGGFQPGGADFAESMAVAGDRTKYEAGDLMVIDPTTNRRLDLAREPYSTLVAGIYSTRPGMLGSTRRIDEAASADEVPLGVVGIVPCKVTTENGSIRVGDLLVTSSMAGHAMKGTDRSRMLGAVVGKALEPLTKGTGVIQVLVTLQ
jgi:hypothetical protein